MFLRGKWTHPSGEGLTGGSGSELQASPWNNHKRFCIFVHLASPPGDVECHMKQGTSKEEVFKFKGAWQEQKKSQIPVPEQ